MKLGILTFHRTINEGSILQAYCLQQLIQSYFPGDQVEIIDYQRSNSFFREIRKLFLKRPPFINVYQLGKYLSLNLFISRHLRRSKRKCITNCFSKANRFIQSQNHDAIVVGSDTVWRIQRLDDDRPSKNIYYLASIDHCRKISFAASIDKSRHALLQQDSLKKDIYSSVSNFSGISVRDQHSQNILSGAGIADKEIFQLPDPSLLWDFSRIVIKPKTCSRSKTIGLSLSSVKLRQHLTGHFINKGFRVLNMLGPAAKGQESIPFHYAYQRRLGMFHQIDLLLTDRFHGSILAFKVGQVPVVFLENMQHYPFDTISKGRDLFNRLNIPWSVHRFNESQFGANDIAAINSILNQWSNLNPNVSRRIDQIRQEAKPKINRLLNSLRPPPMNR